MMALLTIFFTLQLCQFFIVSLALPTSQQCKPHPGDVHWPSESLWQSLNSSVSGRLIKPIPPGAVCHPSWSQFDNATCALVAENWVDTSFHFNTSESVDYNDETCLPDPRAPCSGVGYPNYIVEAINVEDVQAAVKFAKKTGVRLVVKGTGHDFPGRSSGPDSLSIYTRQIRGLETVSKLESSSPTQPAALIKVSAGERMTDIMDFAVDNDLTIIGGADPHVGIGGWIQGGGHGPITAKYGMGADQVVEMEVVTADGEYLTINEDCEPDLFWAMRGAGGSTFAVIVSVTIRAYPSFPATEYLFSYNTTSDSEAFWSMSAYFHSQLPRLSEAGIMGYYFMFPYSDFIDDPAQQGQMSGDFIAPGLSPAEVKAIMKPMEDHMANADWGDPVYPLGIPLEHEDFMTWWADNPPQDAGISGRLGSRILDEKALATDMEDLKTALRTTTPVGWIGLGHLTAGPGTHNPPNGIPGGSNAVGPAWRTGYTHVVLSRSWTPLNETEKDYVTTQLRDVEVEALRQIAPDTGAYVNEIDPTEPNYIETMYGVNYPQLLETKQKWDPAGVFWCNNCVGSELWEAIGPYGIENGVGQNRVKLCAK